MGRQVTGTQMDEEQVYAKSDCSITDSATDAAEISEDNIEGAEYEVKECTKENTEFYEKQEGSSVRDGKLVNLEVENSGNCQETKSPVFVSPWVAKNKSTVPKPFMLATEKRVCASRSTGVNSEGSDAICGVNSPRSVKNSQMNSPILSRRLFRGDDKKSQDDDNDCWSLTSSAAGSVKSNKYRTTVASAPVFKCTERAEKRKEFYKKLEEKHRALEEERMQFEARIKEEQDAVLKQLRKNMTYKANPVPDFYRQGPPPKPESKKLPVTRPKSPKFNTNRSDAAASQVEEKEKVPARSVSHSTGANKQETQTPSHINRKIPSNGSSRVSASPPTPKSDAPNSPPHKIDEHASSDISV